MHIYGPSQIHGAQPVHAPHAPRAAQPSAPSAATPVGGDRLDISEAGQIAGRLSDVPEIRADRVAEIRAAIVEGTYETGEKLATAVERLLDEIA
jgi:negative regulator of flagellin synthesis FlgM